MREYNPRDTSNPFITEEPTPPSQLSRFISEYTDKLRKRLQPGDFSARLNNINWSPDYVTFKDGVCERASDLEDRLRHRHTYKTNSPQLAEFWAEISTLQGMIDRLNKQALSTSRSNCVAVGSMQQRALITLEPQGPQLNPDNLKFFGIDK